MMKYFLLFMALTCISVDCLAEETQIALDHAPIQVHDIASIKRGAKFFATNCMACHTLIYMRYNSLAQEAGVTYDRMPVNVKNWPLNVTPPDLSLEASVRGVDWIYTYLHSFYTDPSRPTGVNNLLVPNTAMPGIIAALQGQQVLATDVRASKRYFGGNLQWYDLLILQSQGALSPQQFDASMTDVVNFLYYSAEPYRAEQNRLGYWVIGFLVILWVMMYYLKKNYWKDIKK